jgi:uncharacterized membrane protein YdbT with pleckstrin-like domain
MKIKPSQWINTGWILIGIVGSFLYVPVLIALYKMLELYCWSYVIENNYITERKGIFSVNHKELSISRIKGMRFEEPFLMRLVGIGNLYIQSSDPYLRELKLWGIPKGSALWMSLRKKSEQQRRRNGFREYDVYHM